MSTPANPLADIQVPVKKMIEEVIFPQINEDRPAVIAGAEKRDHYWRGNQHLVMEGGGGSYRWVPVQESRKVRDLADAENSRIYDYTINHYRGDGNKFIAVIGQRAPNVKCVPDKPGDEELLEIASKGDQLASVFRAAWEVSRKQKLMAYHQWNTTTSFHYTYWNSDGEKYGYTVEPKIEWVDEVVKPGGFHCVVCGTFNEEQQAIASEVCLSCGNPLDPNTYSPEETEPKPEKVGEETYANGMVELRVCDIYSVTVPREAESIQDCGWLRFEEYQDPGSLVDIYPQLAPKLGKDMPGNWGGHSDIAASARDRMAALEASTAGRNDHKKKWLYTEFWLHGRTLNHIKDEEWRKKLKAKHPRGAVFIFVNSELVDVKDQAIRDHWSECKPSVSPTILADPIGKDMLPVCDAMNDFLNYNVAAGERISPVTIADPTVLDPDQFAKKRALPGDMIFAMPNSGKGFGDSFHTFKVAELSPELMSFGDLSLTAVRETTGVLRPIFGGDSGSQTATEAEQKRVQALMQLSLPYDEIRACWERTYQNATRIFARMARGGVRMRGVVLTPEEVQEYAVLADAAIHFEAEEGVPMTYAQQRALWFSFFDKGPDVWNLVGLGDPDNKRQMLDKVGMGGLRIPYVDDIDKIQGAIRQLLQERPIPGQVGMEPSVPVDDFEDDHPFVADYIRQWAQKKEAREARKTNPEGYMNVVLWGVRHKTLAQMAMAPPPGPDGQPQGGQPPALPGPESQPPMGLLAPPANQDLAQTPAAPDLVLQ